MSITSGASGSGIGAVTFSVAANATGTLRTGTLSVAGQTVTITQGGPGSGTVPPAPTNLRFVSR